MSLKLRLVLSLFWFSNIAVSQNFTSKLFTTDQGLPDTYIYSVVQDKEGFLWIATGKGLVKFDGQVFIKHNLHSEEQDDIIYSGVLDSRNEMWFGSFSGRIYKFDKTKNRLMLYPKSIQGSVNKIIASKGGSKLYFFSKGNGIYYLENNKLEKIPVSQNYEINALEEMDQNTLLVSTNEGLYLLEVATDKMTPLTNFEFEISQVQKLTKQKNGYLVLVADKGIFEVRIDNQKSVAILKFTDVLSKNFPEGISTFCYNESNNDLYVGSKSERFASLNLVSGKLKVLDENDFMANANSIFIDREFNIWVTTTGKGLYRFFRTEFDFIEVKKEGVFSITQDTIGNTYYGTKNGITVANAQGDLYRTINQIGSIKLGKINALYCDKQHKLWIGTDNLGLFVVDPVTLKKLELDFSDISNISINAINGSERDNEIQVCTNLDGVYNYSGYRLMNHFSVQNSLLHNNVFSSLKAKNGKVYYATHNTSFNFSQVNQIYEIDIKDNGLISDFNCFAESDDGHILIGTNGEGLYKLNDTTIRPFEFNHTLESKFCKGMIFDKEQNLWIMLGKNLYKYYSKDKVLKEIDFSLNYRSTFNPNAIYKNKNGDIFFGTTNYVVHYNNSEGLTHTNYAPKSYLLGLRVNDSLVSTTTKLELAHGKYNFKFEYSALSLKNSEAVLYKYKLLGRDENWSELTKSRKIEFSNLADGSYTFMVMAFNSEGFVEKQPTSFEFSIRIPFWKTNLFWVLVVILLTLLVVLIIRVRTASLIRAKIILEKKVKEKTKELQKEKETVEMNNVIIAAQNEEITSSITYAKRIQEAILPNKTIDSKYQENILIYYKPKDIVSGDFYWYTEKDNKFLVAAFDCTGHGVPGAFMSMIGTTLLNKIVLDQGELNPAMILTEMDKEVSKSLRQIDSEVNDGMEAGLCCIDFKTNELLYSGAKRPLLLYRKTADSYELHEYKAGKFPIGGFADITDKSFIQHLITVQKGDMLYLFSDGIVDQFDSGNTKRISSKRVKELLLTLASLPMSEQAVKLESYITEWKGNTKQTDDILILGIRF